MHRLKYTCIPEREIGPFGPYGPDWPTVCFLSFMLGVLIGGMLTVYPPKTATQPRYPFPQPAHQFRWRLHRKAKPMAKRRNGKGKLIWIPDDEQDETSWGVIIFVGFIALILLAQCAG